MADTIFFSHLLGWLDAPPDQRNDLDAVDILQPVEMFFSECATTGECDFHG